MCTIPDCVLSGRVPLGRIAHGRLDPMPDMNPFNATRNQVNDAPVGSAVEVHVPATTVLAIAGNGSPASDEFRQGVRDLWRVAYAIQQLPKGSWVPEGFAPYDMPPTEIVFDSPNRDCPWRLFLPQPDFVDQDVLDRVTADLDAAAKKVRGEVCLAHLDPDHAVQSMHIGLPAGQPAAIALIEQHAAALGLTVTGHHHEILIDDPVRIGFDVARNLIRYSVNA